MHLANGGGTAISNPVNLEAIKPMNSKSSEKPCSLAAFLELLSFLSLLFVGVDKH